MRARRTWTAAAVSLTLLLGLPALAHAISDDNASYVQALDGPAVAAFTYLGAKHMVTGIDHLLFLVGVVFFLHRLKDVVLYVSLFTLGHSITLLAGGPGRFRRRRVSGGCHHRTVGGLQGVRKHGWFRAGVRVRP